MFRETAASTSQQEVWQQWHHHKPFALGYPLRPSPASLPRHMLPSGDPLNSRARLTGRWTLARRWIWYPGQSANPMPLWRALDWQTDTFVFIPSPPYLLHSGFHFSQVLPLKSCSSYLSSGLKSYGTDLQRSNPFLGRVLFHPGVLIIPQWPFHLQENNFFLQMLQEIWSLKCNVK